MLALEGSFGQGIKQLNESVNLLLSLSEEVARFDTGTRTDERDSIYIMDLVAKVRDLSRAMPGR
jgi:hypothetical protein